MTSDVALTVPSQVSSFWSLHHYKRLSQRLFTHTHLTLTRKYILSQITFSSSFSLSLDLSGDESRRESEYSGYHRRNVFREKRHWSVFSIYSSIILCFVLWKKDPLNRRRRSRFSSGVSWEVLIDSSSSYSFLDPWTYHQFPKICESPWERFEFSAYVSIATLNENWLGP